MLLKMLKKWLTTYDPIHRGWTPAGIANGLCATSGFFFPRVTGGYNLYRGVDAVPEPPAEPVGAAGGEATVIQTFPWVVHEGGLEYTYRLVPVSGGGVENWMDAVVTAARFDPAGDFVGRLPNAPTDLQLVPLAGGRLAVRWTYLPHGQETAPAGFRLYGSDNGRIDYGSTAGQVAYAPGRLHYEYITQPAADGLRVGWAVRAYAETGREEQNLAQAFTFTRANPPPVNPVVQVTLV